MPARGGPPGSRPFPWWGPAYSGFVAAALGVPGVPGVPQGVSASWLTSRSAQVSFSVPLTGGGTTRTKSGMSGSLTVSSLTAGKTYQCRVRASNAVGNGAYGRLSPRWSRGVADEHLARFGDRGWTARPELPGVSLTPPVLPATVAPPSSGATVVFHRPPAGPTRALAISPELVSECGTGSGEIARRVREARGSRGVGRGGSGDRRPRVDRLAEAFGGRLRVLHDRPVGEANDDPALRRQLGVAGAVAFEVGVDQPV